VPTKELKGEKTESVILVEIWANNLKIELGDFIHNNAPILDCPL
jgi:hypothetical protein